MSQPASYFFKVSRIEHNVGLRIWQYRASLLHSAKREGATMDKFIHRENLSLFKKRLSEARDDAMRRVLLRLLAEVEAKDPVLSAGVKIMNRKGVEFTLVQVEPDLWIWRFQIGETETTGKAHAKVMGLAAHRVQQRIDRELRKVGDRTAGRTDIPN
jgi:hypothetical protein